MVDHLRLDVDAVDALAATLADAAERARLLAGRVAEAQLVGGVLGSPVARLGFVEETAALLARVLRARAGDAAGLDVEPRLARWFDGTAVLHPVAADLHGPLAAYGERRVAEVLALARRASLRSGAPSGRALAAAFADLTSVELDRVVRRLTTAELRAVWREVRRPPDDGGLTADEQRAFTTFVAERIDRGSWVRLAAAAPGLEPSLAPVVDRLDGQFSDGTDVQWTVADLQGPLAVPTPGDPAAIDDSDERQGYLGDCYLHAGLQALAAHHPELLAQMLRRNANGTVTVTFADGRQVVVDPTFVTDTRYTRQPRLAEAPDLDDGRRGGERWAAVIEKAYATLHGGYDEIWSGRPEEAIEALVGGTSEELDADRVDPADLARRLATGELLTLGTPRRGTPVDGRAEPLSGHHAYRLVAVDPDRGTATLEDPHAPGGARPIEVPMAVVVGIAAARTGFLVANRVPAAADGQHGGEVTARR